MKMVSGVEKLLELTELTLNEGASYLVVEFDRQEDSVTIMEILHGINGVVWATSCDFKSVEWIREALDDIGIDYEYRVI